MSAAANRMAAKVAESATKAVGAAGAAGKAARAGASGEGKKGKETVLQKGAKRDPELYVGHYGYESRSSPNALTDTSNHHDWRFRSCRLPFRYAKCNFLRISRVWNHTNPSLPLSHRAETYLILLGSLRQHGRGNNALADIKRQGRR